MNVERVFERWIFLKFIIIEEGYKVSKMRKLSSFVLCKYIKLSCISTTLICKETFNVTLIFKGKPQ